MYERMLDKQIIPSIDDMAAHCGESEALFRSLLTWMALQPGTEQKIVFPYGNHYGWSAAQRRKGKLICHIFAEKDAFTVMMHLSDRQYRSIYAQLLPYTQDFIDHRYPCGDGGWIHYRITRPEHLADIQQLLSLK